MVLYPANIGGFPMALLLLISLTNCRIHLEKLYACYQYKRQSLDGQCVTAGE